MNDAQKKHLIRAFLKYWRVRLIPEWAVLWRSGFVAGGTNGHPPYGHAECYPSYEDKRAFIRFNLLQMSSREKIERTVIHELFHCLTGEEESREEHQLIRRLERPIRRIRLRAGEVI